MLAGSPEHDFRRFCAAGDTAALGRVFERLAPELLLVAAHLAGGDAAEDLVQATFLDAIGQRARWDQRRPLAPWLCGILANHVLRARRERSRVPDPHRLPFKDSESPQAEAEAREVAELVRRAVEGLPLGYGQVLSLRLVHGLELQQIASALFMPLGTVKTRLHRGMVLLRRALPASLASTLAIALLPGRGLAAMREVVLSHAATAVPAATAGIMLGALTMKKAVLITGVVAFDPGRLPRDHYLAAR
jgi:RNA polymerase sigma-70 factor (ECF subfamily)